jgi:hypothetical protein
MAGNAGDLAGEMEEEEHEQQPGQNRDVQEVESQ